MSRSTSHSIWLGALLALSFTLSFCTWPCEANPITNVYTFPSSLPLAGFGVRGDGTLYGISINAGSKALGELFTVSAATGPVDILDWGTGQLSYLPTGPVQVSADGRIYGLSEYDDGVGIPSIYNWVFNSSTLQYAERALGDGGATSLDAGGDLIADEDVVDEGVAGLWKITGQSFTNLIDYPSTWPIYGDEIDAIVVGSDGNVYGLAEFSGIVFELNLSTNPVQCSVLHTFAAPEGAGLTLVQAADSSLIVATSGGIFGKGGLYRLHKSLGQWIFSLVHSFNGTDGANANALMLASDGYIYGTAGGGTNGHGVLFQFKQIGDTFTILHRFTGVDGDDPQSVLEGPRKMLYGWTKAGYGNIFSMPLPVNVTIKSVVLSQQRPTSPISLLVTFANHSAAPASDFTITKALLGVKPTKTITPVLVGTIAPGATGQATIVFGANAFAGQTSATLGVTATYNANNAVLKDSFIVHR